MTWDHQVVMIDLACQLRQQFPRHDFRVQAESRVRRPEATVLQPDVMVIPDDYGDEFRNQPGRLAIFSRPLPFVAEVWSVSTGEYDVMAKLPIYMQRGEMEIWLIHPYEKTVTSWRRQPDGTYCSSIHQEGVMRPVVLPDVVIDVVELFL